MKMGSYRCTALKLGFLTLLCSSFFPAQVQDFILHPIKFYFVNFTPSSLRCGDIFESCLLPSNKLVALSISLNVISWLHLTVIVIRSVFWAPAL